MWDVKKDSIFIFFKKALLGPADDIKVDRAIGEINKQSFLFCKKEKNSWQVIVDNI